MDAFASDAEFFVRSYSLGPLNVYYHGIVFINISQ